MLNETARVGCVRQTEGMPTDKHPGSLGTMQSGDVLVSHATALREHEISVVPNTPHANSPTHDAAVREGRSEADALGVDAWLTEDKTHVVQISTGRRPGKEVQADVAIRDR